MIFWLVILVLLVGFTWGAVHHYRIERDIKRALKEFDDEV